jgi:hypothetical protein
MNSFGTRSLRVKSICAMNVCRARSWRVPGEYRSYWKLMDALCGACANSLRLTF